MLSLYQRLAVVATLSFASPVSMASAQTADTVLFNGKILTVDKDFSVQQALAIGHGQVLAFGTEVNWIGAASLTEARKIVTSSAFSHRTGCGRSNSTSIMISPAAFTSPGITVSVNS